MPDPTSKSSDHAGESSDENHRKRAEADPNSPNQTTNDDEMQKVQAGELESAKAEMGEVMEENQRLKQYLDQIMKDYQALQMKFYEITQQADSKNPNKTNLIITNSSRLPSRAIMEDDQDEAELVSLSLGRTSSLDSKKSISNKSNIQDDKLVNKEKDVANGSKSYNVEGPMERSLDLGLDCKFETSKTTALDHQQALMPSSSPDNSLDDMKDGEAGEKQTSTALKRSGSGDDEVVQQPPVKKARVSVRVRCDTPTMNDGCQWRKYGQKIAKGNPCPRAYYRCTVAPSCPVRKQVQRCAEDMSILITTYEGTHNHPLPVSATAMASTTSAAAYMLMSGSSSSGHQGSNSTTTTTLATTGAELHSGLNFNIPDSSKLKPLYLPNSSSTFLPAPTHPTITLDLTSTPSSSATQFNRATPSFAPRYPSTNLNFNSSNNPNNNPSISWPNIGLLNYATQPPNNKSQFSPLDFGSSRHPTLQDASSFNFQTFLQKGNPNNPSNPPPVPDTIAQAAKVLTSDPSFQAALTAALSSFISSSNGNVGAGILGGDINISDLAQKIKWGGVQTSSNVHSSTSQSTNKGTNNGCGSRLLSMASSATNNSQPNGSLMFLPPPLPLPGSKSTSTSPGDSRDNAN